jgi:hypothetical protein
MQNRTDGRVVKHARWTKAYTALLRDPTLSPGARILILALRSYCPHNRDTSFPSTSTLLSDLGCSRRSLFYWLTELENAGWLRRELRYRTNGSKSSTLYHLLDERKSLVKEAFLPHTPSSKFCTTPSIHEKPNAKYAASHRQKQPLKHPKIIRPPSVVFCTT